jgi:Protein of unknown function (DUF3891)
MRATLPGFSAKYVKSLEMVAVNRFLQHLKLQQLRLRTELRMSPAMKGLADEKGLERGTRLLEPLDGLSLYFCLHSQGKRPSTAYPRKPQGMRLSA